MLVKPSVTLQEYQKQKMDGNRVDTGTISANKLWDMKEDPAHNLEDRLCSVPDWDKMSRS